MLNSLFLPLFSFPCQLRNEYRPSALSPCGLKSEVNLTSTVPSASLITVADRFPNLLSKTSTFSLPLKSAKAMSTTLLNSLLRLQCRKLSGSFSFLSYLISFSPIIILFTSQILFQTFLFGHIFRLTFWRYMKFEEQKRSKFGRAQASHLLLDEGDRPEAEWKVRLGCAILLSFFKIFFNFITNILHNFGGFFYISPFSFTDHLKIHFFEPW